VTTITQEVWVVEFREIGFSPTEITNAVGMDWSTERANLATGQIKSIYTTEENARTLQRKGFSIRREVLNRR
jgi:hypothetical protein